MNDCSIIALSLCAEAIGIDAENYLWRTIKEDDKNDFLNLIARSNFNKRRRRRQLFIQEVKSNGIRFSGNAAKGLRHCSPNYVIR
jgi:hypothetical protein